MSEPRRGGPPPPPPPPPPGPRRTRLQERRQRRKKRGLWATVALVTGSLLVVGALAFFGSRAITNDGDDGSSSNEGPLAADVVETLLLVGTRDDGRAAWMNLLAYNSEEASGAVIYLPAHTAAEVPGRGLAGVGEALESGDISLLRVSLENLLGTTIDHYAALSVDRANELLSGVGDLEIDIPGEVKISAGSGRARVLFSEGPQILPAPLLDDLLFTIGLEGDEAELGNRHLAFWDAVFEQFEGRPPDLAAAFEAAGIADSDLDPAELGSFFEELAALEQETLQLASLPVQQEIVGDAELYSTDGGEIDRFMTTMLGPGLDQGEQLRVQILNGNGVPGIGQEVADRLVGEGFQIVLSGNADRLDYQSTLIVTYEDTPDVRARAEQVRALLGVGKVEVSVQQQGIVDLTIVVGRDFIGTTEQGG